MEKRAMITGSFMTENGQALAEIAVFGALFLLLMGALINYGVRYNLQQKAQMDAFRTALRIAQDPERGSGSISIIRESHIPDPMDPFGMGSSAPISASARVTRDFNQDASPADVSSLPVSLSDLPTDTRIDGTPSERMGLYGAAFRIETMVPNNSNTIDKYRQVFGSIGALRSGVVLDTAIANPDGNWVSPDSDDASITCSPSCETVVEGGEGGPTTIYDSSNEHLTAIKIVDSCVGQALDYKGCRDQATRIVDPEYCEYECQKTKSPGAETNCAAVCAAAINIPWYVVPYSRIGELSQSRSWTPRTYTYGVYFFNTIESIFSFVAVDELKVMGMQPDQAIFSRRDQALRRTESSASIQTDERASWTQRTDREAVYVDNMDTTTGIDTIAEAIRRGLPAPPVVRAHVNVSSILQQSADRTWTTTK